MIARTPFARRTSASLVLSAAALLAGCASLPRISYNASVMSYGDRVERDPVAIAHQPNDLKAKYLADALAHALGEAGLKVEAGSRTRLAFSAQVDDGKTVTVSVPVWGQVGISSVSRVGNTSYLNPAYGVTGYRTSSSTEYTRKITLSVLDAEKEVARRELTSKGSSEHLESVFPFLSLVAAHDLVHRAGTGRKSYSLDCYDPGKVNEKNSLGIYTVQDSVCVLRAAGNG